MGTATNSLAVAAATATVAAKVVAPVDAIMVAAA